MGGVDGKRKLDNWVDGFLEWTLPRSETPKSMLTWMGLAALSAIVKRKVWVPKTLLGGYEIFPNLYIVLVGEPAVVRKSTTLNFAEELLITPKLKGDDRINFAGDVTSHSKLLDTLSQSPDGSVCIMSGEFSSLIQTTPEAMYEILTDLFDNKASLSWSTWAHGNKAIKDPVVNLTAATTPAWISKQPPEYFVEGGFASRVIFLYEEEPRQREIYYDHLNWEELNQLQEDLTHDIHIISKVKGEFRHDSKKTKEFIRSWYQKQNTNSIDPRLKGYHGRKHVHAHKVAMLLSLAEGNERVITIKHWRRAIKLLDEIEKKMHRTFVKIGANPFAVIMEEIRDYVEREGQASMKQIAGRFYREGFTFEQLKSALTFLCTADELSADGSIANPTYKRKKKR